MRVRVPEEREGTEQPQRQCGKCEAPVKPGNSFCTACGERVSVETKDSGQACTAWTLDDLTTGNRGQTGRGIDFNRLKQNAHQFYQGVSARFRNWKEARAAETKHQEALREQEDVSESTTPRTEHPGGSAAESASESLPGVGSQRDGEESIPDEGGVRKAPRETRLEYDRYRGFFQVARDGLVRFSERLKDEVDEPDREKSLPSKDLAQALLHAQNGLNKTGEYKEILTGPFQDEAHQESAMAMLAELRGAQETVATLLELFYDDIESAEGYTQFEEEFARWYLEDLEPHLQRNSAHEQQETGYSVPTPSSAGSFDGNIREIPGRLVRWFKDLPPLSQVVLVGLVLLALVLLSPLTRIVAALLLVVSIVALLLQANQRRFAKGWGIVAVASLILMFAFGGISNALYGTESNGDTKSKAKGSSKAAVAEELEPVEREYLERTAEINREMAEIMDRQMELYNFCLEVCGPQSFPEMMQNEGRSSKLLKDTKALSPPDAYQESYAAFTAGVDTASDLIRRIPYRMIGGREGDSLAQEAVGNFRRAYNLAPERGQRFYDEYSRTHPLPSSSSKSK